MSIMNAAYERENWMRRAREFDGPVADTARNNPLLYDIIQRYAHGEIITREEALSQMVVLLAKDWSDMQKRAFELHQRITAPIVFA